MDRVGMTIVVNLEQKDGVAQGVLTSVKNLGSKLGHLGSK